MYQFETVYYRSLHYCSIFFKVLGPRLLLCCISVKRQRLAKSGEGGEDGFDELDVIVLDIIGKSSSNKAGETRGVVPASSRPG